MRMVKKQNRRNNRMVIFKKDKGGSHGVGGKQLQKEENASEKLSLEASLRQDGVGVSLYQEKTERRQRRRKKQREIPACNLHQPQTLRPGCAPRRPALLPPQQIQTSSVWFGPRSSSPDTAWMQPEVSAVFCRGHSLGLPHDTVRNLRSSHMAA